MKMNVATTFIFRWTLVRAPSSLKKLGPPLLSEPFLKENTWKMPVIEDGGYILHPVCSIFGEI